MRARLLHTALYWWCHDIGRWVEVSRNGILKAHFCVLKKPSSIRTLPILEILETPKKQLDCDLVDIPIAKDSRIKLHITRPAHVAFEDPGSCRFSTSIRDIANEQICRCMHYKYMMMYIYILYIVNRHVYCIYIYAWLYMICWYNI